MSPEHLAQLQSALAQTTGFIYPNEVELHWSILIVIYPYITGLVAGAFILASLAKVFNVKEVQPTYRLALLTALAFLTPALAAQHGTSVPQSHQDPPLSDRAVPPLPFYQGHFYRLVQAASWRAQTSSSLLRAFT